jgi:PAS domain S-box-containing protein
MSTARKTDKQLIDEVAELRCEVATLKKMAEQQESKITELKRGIGQSISGHMQLMDALYVIFDRKYEFVNQTFENLFGYRKDEICQSRFDIMKVITPEYRSAVEKTFTDGIRGNYNIRNFKFEGLKKDGIKIECDTSVIFIPYKWGTSLLLASRMVSPLSCRLPASRNALLHL